MVTAHIIDEGRYLVAARAKTAYLRSSIADGYSNLKVYTHTLANMILFSPNMTATGVDITAYGSKFILSAKREIVFSVGALLQLLMASVIGPRAELEENDIEVLVD